MNETGAASAEESPGENFAKAPMNVYLIYHTTYHGKCIEIFPEKSDKIHAARLWKMSRIQRRFLKKRPRRAAGSLPARVREKLVLDKIPAGRYNRDMSELKVKRPKTRRTKKKRILFVFAAILLVLVILGGAFYLVFSARSRVKTSTPDEVERLELDEDNTAHADVRAGEMLLLSLTDDVDVNAVAFSSDAPDVVRVDAAGRVDALSEGEAVVTASSGGFSAAYRFSVAAADEETADTAGSAIESVSAFPEEEVTTAVTANADVVQKNLENGVFDLFNIVVNRRTNTVTVYTYDEHGNYTVPVRAMIASCGTGGKDITPTGTFALYFKERWHELYGGVYGQYVCGFSGAYLFHSVPYNTMRADDLETDEFNKLGTNASQGCVRMAVSDCRWIYRNCALNTPVTVIDEDASADPLGTPGTVKVSEKMTWDPTDPHSKNPYKGKTPVIAGAEDKTVPLGEDFDMRAGVTAEDACGNDLTYDVQIYGTVLTEKAGDYYLTYAVIDGFRQKTEKTVKITVE